MHGTFKVAAATAAILLTANLALAVTTLTTDAEKRSYALGANVGKNIKMQAVAVDPALVSQGLLDEMAGKSLLSDAELAAVMKELQGEIIKKMQAQQEKAAVENKKRGEEFMARNARQAGVKTLAGGIQYKVLVDGKGKKPTENDTVQCNYRGMLVDGKVFDSSAPGNPVSFKLTQVIPGWREALKNMPVGSKWQLVIPAEQAYGARGAGNAIGPNETLIFEVELVAIQ